MAEREANEFDHIAISTRSNCQNETGKNDMQINTSRWKTKLSEERIARFTGSGHWNNLIIAHNAAEMAVRFSNDVALVDGTTIRTHAQIFEEALRLAEWFRSNGLQPGDVISFQLPNWWETVTINLAACISGLIVNPIVPIYRDAEVEYILKNSESRIFFIPEVFRSINYVEMVDKLRPLLPNLETIVVVRGQATRDDFVCYGDWNEGNLLASMGVDPSKPPELDPNTIKMLLYTSGTTGRAKGVLHSHNAIQAEIAAVTKFWDLTKDDVILMPSPVTHITGYIYGIELMSAIGCKLVYMDKWNADHAVDLIAEHEVTFSIGATPFLVELVTALEKRGESSASLRLFACGGAPVAPEVIRRAQAVLPNCLAFRVYGSSEAPTVTAGVASGDPVELGATTDGCILNYEVKIVDPVTGERLRDGTEGEILVRGPELMLGYAEWQDTLDAFDDEDYFRTGDLGFISHERYITISGRKKDLIIRGGENISAKEVEDVLHNHPAIAEAAVVAMPDERLGETPVAYVVLRKGKSVAFEELKAFLEEAKLARQKFPERLFILAEMPRTASGKILKHVLRAQCQDGGDDA